MEEIIEEYLIAVYKTSVWVGLAYAGVIVAMFFDLVSGVKKARKLGEATTSTGLKKTASKAAKYFSPMLCLTIIDIMLSIHISSPVFTLLWATYCVLCEWRSIMEKSWQKAELREAANTMNVIVKNKEDIAKVLVELIGEMKLEKGGTENESTH